MLTASKCLHSTRSLTPNPVSTSESTISIYPSRLSKHGMKYSHLKPGMWYQWSSTLLFTSQPPSIYFTLDTYSHIHCIDGWLFVCVFAETSLSCTTWSPSWKRNTPKSWCSRETCKVSQRQPKSSRWSHLEKWFTSWCSATGLEKKKKDEQDWK